MTEYERERALLLGLFSRGRVKRDADGTCILTGRTRRSAGDHVFIQSPGRSLGLYYAGRPSRYLSKVGGLVLKHLDGDGDGILHLAWAPEVAKRLPMFSRRAPSGRPFDPATGEVSPPRRPSESKTGQEGE